MYNYMYTNKRVCINKTVYMCTRYTSMLQITYILSERNSVFIHIHIKVTQCYVIVEGYDQLE